MTPADRARELAIPLEMKKHGLRQQQSGEWVISFTVHPSDMAAAISLAPMGTRYQAALVELSDDGTAKEVMQDIQRPNVTTDAAPVREQEPARAQRYDEMAMSSEAIIREDRDEWENRLPRPLAHGFEAEPPKRRLEQPRTPVRFDEMTMTAQAGLLANDASFQRYLQEIYRSAGKLPPLDAAETAQCIRYQCNVTSRREIQPTNAAGKAWLNIVKQYRVWQLAPRVGA